MMVWSHEIDQLKGLEAVVVSVLIELDCEHSHALF